MSPIRVSHITLRSLLFYICCILGVVTFVVYGLFQARFILEGPQIVITSDNSPAQTERTITLEGNARNIVRMTLNGRQIFTDKSGDFKEALVLENGYTIATLRAEDRYGRATNLTKEFVHIQPDQQQVIN